MLKRCLFILVITCIFQSTYASFGLFSLNQLLAMTTNFFEQLKLDYGMFKSTVRMEKFVGPQINPGHCAIIFAEARPITPELYQSIDKKIDEYVKKVRNSTNSTREKRQLDLDKAEIGILRGFENVPGLDMNDDDAIDVSFFVRGNGDELRWYAATLNYLGITLLQYQDGGLIKIGWYNVDNGTRLISHASNLEDHQVTILVVQRSVGDTFVLRFSEINTGQQMVHKVQTLDTRDAIDSILWRGMKKIYLAVVSSKKLTVFIWLGEHFDRIQSEDIGAKKLVPFQTGGSMYLVAIDQSQSYVFKFFLSSSEFVVVQKLAGAEDGTAFHLEKGHVGEHFLALATGKRSTIIYKQTRHRLFVPFQQLPDTKKIRSLTIDAAVLLIIIINKNGEIVIYQYDGWKFVESGIFRQTGIIVDAIPLSLHGQQLFALKIKNSIFNHANAPHYYFDNSTNFRVEQNQTLRSNIWSFKIINWTRRKSCNSLRQLTKIWCRNSLEKTRRIAAALPKRKTLVRVQKGHVKNLRVHEVNGHRAKKFVTLSERWNTIVSETMTKKNLIKNYVSTVNPVFKNLKAANVRVNCTSSRCYAPKIETTAERQFFQRLRKLDNVNKNLNFRKVKVSFADNLPCPVAAPKFERVTVTGLVNGIYFPSFVHDVMKITGDQQLNACYTFAKLGIVNGKIPLDVASNYTRQDVVAETIQVEEVNVTAGGLLVPLNGASSVRLTGSLTVPKARINGLVHLRGGIRGEGAKLLNPMIHITEPLEISNNIELCNVKIVEALRANDITRTMAKSFNEILSNALPLNSDNVSIHFNFHDDKVSWKNLTLQNFRYKWVTKEKIGHVVITGRKYATKPTIVLNQLAYENLPTPKLPLRLCSINVTSEAIWESNLIIDRGTAKSVKTINVFEQSKLGKFYSDVTTGFDEISWAVKKFTGKVTVKKSNIESITGIDYQGLIKSIAIWAEPGHVKTFLKVPNLRVKNLITPRGFILSLPTQVGNVESQQNIYVDKFNNIDYMKFLDNAVKPIDAISLTNVTFIGGFNANNVFATQTLFNLQENFISGYLGSKEILGSLESEAMIVPHVLKFNLNPVPVKIIANGNVKFEIEPKILNVNDKNLEQLYNDVWLTDRSTIVSAESIELNDVDFNNKLTIMKSFDTPNLGPWVGLENRLLSKTKPQDINVSAYFGSIQAPNVIGAGKSRLRSNVAYLQDLENNSLKKNSTQVITTNWEFDELTITGYLNVQGLVNSLNLATDIVRYDVEKNNITGKKIVGDLTARNINGLKFGKFANNALLRNNGNRTIVIKGWKNFETVEMQDISVEGKIMGQRTENLLLKCSKQIVRGRKLIRGSLKAPAIISNGTINQVNLMQLVKYQLKKRASMQIINSPIMIANNLTIFGNLTIDGLYNGVDLKNLANAEPSFESAIKRTSEIMKFAEGIEVALANRAVYWDKLELLEENSTALKPDPDKNQLLNLDGLGRCTVRQSTLYCNDRKVFDALSPVSNETRVLRGQVLALSGIPLVASVTSDPLGGVSIFRYIFDENRFVRVADLHIPGIVEASITTMTDCLWMSLRLSDDTMILRYELWAKFKQWILPGGGPFLMSSTPTEQLLIFRSDGVWRLGGLAGPRHVYPVALDGQIDTFSFGSDYYVQLLSENNFTTLLKTRYIGN